MGVCSSEKSNINHSSYKKTPSLLDNNKEYNPKQFTIDTNDLSVNEEIVHNRKYNRARRHHLTVKPPTIKLKDYVKTPKGRVGFEKDNPFMKKSSEEIKEEKEENKEPLKKIVFKRKANRSISLIEKNRLGSKLFKEELKLKVTTQTLVEETNGLPNDKYQVVKKLGDGAYGTVFLAHNLITGLKVALKKIVKEEPKQIEDIEKTNKFDIVKKLDHPFIVKIIDLYSTPKAYYIINEYCSHGELYSQIKMRLTEEQLCFIFYQIFSALNYLHSNNIIHRDLKLENILISEIEKNTENKMNYFWIKIIDFGAAKFTTKNTIERTVVGSLYYIAPEVLKKKYNEKCDTWSAGIMLYMFIVGRAPFDGVEDEEILMKIRTGKYNTKNQKLTHSSKEVQDLIKQLLEVRVDKRLSAKEALAHPWFTKFKAKEIFNTLEQGRIKEYVDRLVSFKISSKFQQMILAFIAHNMNYNEECKEIKKLFCVFDTDNDGRLTKKELYEGICKYEKEDKVKNIINDLFTVLNGANNNYIYFEEFLSACLNKERLLTEEYLSYAFKFIDKDNSGIITAEKLKVSFGNENSNDVSSDVFKAIIKEVSSSNEEQMDYDEFKQMMFNC